MSVEIFWGSGSPFAWRVLLALELKGVPYESRLLSFSAREHKTEAFLALNPRGKVPVLKHGDVVIYESNAILAYLDAAFPERPLLGRTPAETGRVWQRILEVDHYVYPAFRAITRPLFAAWTPGSAEVVLAALPEVRTELGRLEEAVGIGDVLVGDEVTAADLVAYPVVASLLRALLKPDAEPLDLGLLPLDEHFPAVGRMMDRVEALPGFAAAWPPHWGPVPQR
jgi:glutathione S-transferase